MTYITLCHRAPLTFELDYSWAHHRTNRTDQKLTTPADVHPPRPCSDHRRQPATRQRPGQSAAAGRPAVQRSPGLAPTPPIQRSTDAACCTTGTTWTVLACYMCTYGGRPNNSAAQHRSGFGKVTYHSVLLPPAGPNVASTPSTHPSDIGEGSSDTAG
jgi:hypothetical protein